MKVLILGNSGTGKSASLRNFQPEEVTVISCAGKPLPFRNHFETVTPAFETLTDDVREAIRESSKPVIVVDDAQYIMSFQYMRRIHESGWDKWNDIQGDFFDILVESDGKPKDTIVYFLSHLTQDDSGHEKIKTMGKMLDEKITIEGLFTTVLKTSVQDGKYYFLTHNSGNDTVKSPMGMFESYAIENDLKYVDTKIRNYYEIGEHVTDEQAKELDKEKAAPEVEKPKPEERKQRTRKPRVKAKPVDEQPAEQAEPEQPRQRKRTRKPRAQAEEPEGLHDVEGNVTVEDVILEDTDVPF